MIIRKSNRYLKNIRFLNLIPLILYITITSCNDALGNFLPDKYDRKMAAIDSQVSKTWTNNELTPENAEALGYENYEKLETQAETLKKFLKIDSIYPITSKYLWEEIYKYIMEHLKELLKNQEISLVFYMRYDFCLFIIPLLPTEYVLAFPSFYDKLIPRKIKQYPIVTKLLLSMANFLKIVRKRSKKEFLPAFRIYKSLTSEKDLEIIKQVPDLIKKDPFKLIKWIVEFHIESLGITSDASMGNMLSK